MANNLLAGIKKQGLKPHKAGPRAMVVPLGLNDGVSPRSAGRIESGRVEWINTVADAHTSST